MENNQIFQIYKKFENKKVSHYKLKNLINIGGFGAVFKSINVDNKKNYAIKMILKINIDDEENFLNECNIMKKLESINVIKYYESFKEKIENYEFYIIVMELCDLNLLEYLNKKKFINLDELREILNQFNNGLKKMFDNNIMHRDIKPENILIKYDNNKLGYIIKLSDFGLAKYLSESGYASSKVGSIFYMAPEIEFKNKYTGKADLYSIGRMLYFFKKKNYIRSNFILDDLIEKLTQLEEKRIDENEYFKHQFFKKEKERWIKYFEEPTKYDLYNYIEDEELKSIQNIFSKIENNLEIKRIDNKNEYYYGEVIKTTNTHNGVGIYLNKKNKFLYKGQFKDNKFNGKGIYYNNFGDRYEGEFKNNFANGKGIYYYNNGDRYEGEFKNYNANGKGIYYYNDGDRYEGEYEDDKKNGKGKFFYNNGDRYEGEYKNDKKNGKGKFYYNNGDRYEGEFKNNQKNGTGKFFYNNGDRYEGEYKDDKKNGTGKFFFNNGDRYEGEYKNDNRIGKGIFYYNKGNKYEWEYKE